MITTSVGHYPKISTDPQAPSLRRAITQLDGGRITPEDLHKVADEVTGQAINEQVDAGLDLVTDGQIRWEDGQTYFARSIKGFTLNGLLRYFDTNTYFRQPIPETSLDWEGPITVRDYQFARGVTSKPVKAVVTGPFTLGHLSQLGCYSDRRSLVMDLAKVMNQEARALQEAGADLIQFDEPVIVTHKEDLPLLRDASEVLVRGISVKTCIQTWFGDIHGIHEAFFQLPFQVFGLDFTMGKRNYEVVNALPPDRELAAGIVDARNTRLETVEEIVERIGTLKKHVQLDRLYLNPSAGLEYLPRATARAKLARLVEGAKSAQEVVG